MQAAKDLLKQRYEEQKQVANFQSSKSGLTFNGI